MSAYGGTDDDAASCADCPVGFLRDVLREAQPEATLHLVTAARELVLAFDAVLRATEETLQRESQGASTPRRRPARVRHIDIA
jgi:hypothetical protein